MKRALFQLDLRTLGLLRIGLGLLLLTDWAKRALYFDLWYSQEGFLPSKLVNRHLTRDHFSLFDYCLTDTATWLGFAAIFFAYLCLLFGIRTKLFQVLSYVGVVSLHSRMYILVNGGDFVICILALWTIFLPLGARFSVDSVFAKGRKGSIVERLQQDFGSEATVTSLAVLALILQLAAIYFLNAANKFGEAWLDGTATYWLAHQERIVTVFGAWLREWVPLGLWKMQTYGTLAIEWALPFLILSPWGRPWTRRAAIVLIWMLHLGIAAIANVGLFSLVMIVYSLCLVSSEDWEALARWLGVHSTMATGLAPPESVPRRIGSLVAQLCVAVLLVVGTSQGLVENQRVSGFRIDQPRWMARVVRYTRLQQGWRMFAPDAPRSDLWLVVDAVTESGERLDPFNHVGSAYSDPALRHIPGPLRHNAYWCEYTARIFGQRVAYRRAFAEWIFRHHERTGDPKDKIESFSVYRITHDSPPPGADEPSNVRATPVMTKRRPRDL